MQQARVSLAAAAAALESDSPLQSRMKMTLEEVSSTARSLRVLADYLERYPQSLLVERIPPNETHNLNFLRRDAVPDAGRCFTTSRPIGYYTLTSLPRPVGQAAGETSTVVAVLPVVVPATIDRPQIVTRTAENQLSFSEYNRWGGSLKEDIGRALVQNLNVLIAGRPVSIVPESLAVDPRYYIAVTVNRLDGRLEEAVWLNAGWTLRDQQAKRTLAIRSFVTESGCPGRGTRIW